MGVLLGAGIRVGVGIGVAIWAVVAVELGETAAVERSGRGVAWVGSGAGVVGMMPAPVGVESGELHAGSNKSRINIEIVITFMGVLPPPLHP